MEGADEIYKGPNDTALRFYYQPVKNKFQSEKHGRAIFDTALMVEVMVPGSRESTPQFEVERTFCEEAGTGPDGGRIVQRSHKYGEYQTQIEAFKNQSGEGLVDGTPLSQWPLVDTGTAATLKAAGVHTVEMLAEVSDSNLHKLGIGGRTLREQAKAFLSSRTFGVPSAQMGAQLANAQAEVQRLNGVVAELTARLAQVDKISSPPDNTSANADPFAIPPATGNPPDAPPTPSVI